MTAWYKFVISLLKYYYRYIYVGYLMARFDYFQDLFVQIRVPTLISLVPSRAQRALSIAKKKISKIPSLPLENPKKLQKKLQKTSNFYKNLGRFACVLFQMIPTGFQIELDELYRFQSKKIYLSPHLHP